MKRLVGARCGDGTQERGDPKERRSKLLGCLHTDAARDFPFALWCEGFHLHVGEARSVFVGDENIDVRRVAKGHDGDVSTAA